MLGTYLGQRHQVEFLSKKLMRKSMAAESQRKKRDLHLFWPYSDEYGQKSFKMAV